MRVYVLKHAAVLALAFGSMDSCLSRVSGHKRVSPEVRDRMVGVWKLDNSKRPFAHTFYGIEDVVSVDRDADRFIITRQFHDKNGVHLSWFISKMDGAAVPIQTPEKPPFPEWNLIRVTRKDANTIALDFALGHEEYSVSADGKTLMLRRELFVDYDPEREFTFRRVI